jgi:hypothetical protein
MTPAERRAKQLAEIFQMGWDNAADFPPLTDPQRDHLAYLIAPHVADPNRRYTTATLPQAA